MVNYQRVLKRLKLEKEDLKEERTFIPSKLSTTKKKSVRYEITKKIGKISEKESELKKKQKESEQRRKQFSKKLSKLARSKVVSKRIVKPSKTTLYLPKKEYPSILSDPNRFFKDELEEVKRSMFFK